ncbi:hypothetical protein DFH09DRAFT_1275719 [Mycena vulgaris]|nr:hypothetical protein DFH09DRAFT_1275719 [Mycena vulgaris]
MRVRQRHIESLNSEDFADIKPHKAVLDRSPENCCARFLTLPLVSQLFAFSELFGGSVPNMVMSHLITWGNRTCLSATLSLGGWWQTRQFARASPSQSLRKQRVHDQAPSPPWASSVVERLLHNVYDILAAFNGQLRAVKINNGSQAKSRSFDDQGKIQVQIARAPDVDLRLLFGPAGRGGIRNKFTDDEDVKDSQATAFARDGIIRIQPHPGIPHAKYSVRLSSKSTDGGRTSRDTTLQRLRRGRLPAVGLTGPVAAMLGKAGLKVRRRSKPQRSRSVRGGGGRRFESCRAKPQRSWSVRRAFGDQLDIDLELGDNGRMDAGDSNIGIWISDMMLLEASVSE